MSETNNSLTPILEENINNSGGEMNNTNTAAGKRILTSIATSSQLVRCAVLFIVASLLLVFMLCPIAKTVAVVDGEEYSIKLSSVDYVKTVFYSLRSLSPDEIEDTKVYGDLLALGYSESGSLNSYGHSKAERMLKNVLFLSLMSESTNVKLTTVAAAIAALLYIAFCVVLFVKSAIALLRELIALARKRKIENTTIAMGAGFLLKFLLFLPLLAYLFPVAASLGYSGGLSLYSAGGTGIAFGFILSFIVALIGFAFFFAYKVINMLREREWKLSECKNLIISFGFALVLLFSTLLPAISTDVTIRQYSRTYEDTVRIGYSDINVLSEEDVRYYSNVSSTEHYKSLYNDLQFIGKKDAIAGTLLNRVVIGCGRIDFSLMLIAIFIINVLIMAVCASLAWGFAKKALYNITVGRAMFWKATLLILTVAQCVLIFIICILSNNAIETVQNLALNFSIGAGPILCMLSSIGILAFSESKEIEEKIIDNYYDNSDVSYAPYVVGYKEK